MKKNSIKAGFIHLYTSLILAIQFYTRLPINISVSTDSKYLASSLLFLPFAGLIIGVFLVILYYLTSLTSASNFLVSVMILSFNAWITGGLHLDGLADTSDAWLGGHSLEKKLTIMKDPRSGVAAIFVLILTLLMQTAALLHILDAKIDSILITLLFVPIMSRSFVLLFFLTTRYGPKGHQGLCSEVFPLISEKWIWRLFILICTFFIIMTLIDGYFIVLLFSGFIVFWQLRQWSCKHLGGFTGDILGAFIVLTETVAWVAIACLPLK